MAKASRHVPAAVGKPAPESPKVWDTAAIEGPDRHKIAALLDELTELAEVDWAYRHLIKRPGPVPSRRDQIFIELYQLKVTLGRMTRAYAIACPPTAEGRPLITHVGIRGVIEKAGVLVERNITRPEEEEESD
jgi:hypothetical protein